MDGLSVIYGLGPLILALLMMVVNWLEAKGQAFLCHCDLPCFSLSNEAYWSIKDEANARTPKDPSQSHRRPNLQTYADVVRHISDSLSSSVSALS